MSRSGRNAQSYDEDLFAETRMSFGEHIEELRVHLWRAIVVLFSVVLFGFVLDGIGAMFDLKLFGYPIGIGRPAMKLIGDPVEKALVEYYDRRVAKVEEQWKKEENHELKEVELRVAD